MDCEVERIEMALTDCVRKSNLQGNETVKQSKEVRERNLIKRLENVQL